LNGWEPLLTTTTWPAVMRIGHGLEITADALVHSAIAVWLLVPRGETT